MRPHIYVLGMLSVVIVMGFNPFAYGEISVSMGGRYDTFADNLSPEGKGNEITIPVGIVYKQERFCLRLETAYSQANVDTSKGAEVKISHITDTLLAGSYMFPNLPVGVVVGLDVNLPTGKERLKTNELDAEVGEDHDLFEVDDFGEGVNVGLSLGLVKEFGSLNVGVTGVYIFKGQYDRTQEIANDDFNPGDQALIFALLKWKGTSWLQGEIFVAYSHISPDQVNDQQTCQEGDKIVLGGNVHIRRQSMEIVVGMQNTFQGKNQESVGETWKTESQNSNGNEFYSWIDITYRYSAKLDLRLLGDLRYYTESERKSGLHGLPVEGKRVRYAIGPGARYILNDHLSWNVLAKYFILDQNRDIFLTQDVTFRGMNLSVGMTYTF